MTEAGIRDLMKRSEDVGIEFKPKVTSRREITEYAVGIGNSGVAFWSWKQVTAGPAMWFR